jgi:hypothetical protein
MRVAFLPALVCLMPHAWGCLLLQQGLPLPWSKLLLLVLLLLLLLA